MQHVHATHSLLIRMKDFDLKHFLEVIIKYIKLPLNPYQSLLIFTKSNNLSSNSKPFMSNER
jgi:hypothetical protein